MIFVAAIRDDILSGLGFGLVGFLSHWHRRFSAVN